MRKSEIIAIVFFSIIFFSFGIGWAEKNSSSVFLLAANKKINRVTSPSTEKPVQQFVIKRPDLTINNMSWSFPLKQGYIVGENSILNFTLKNHGKAPSGNFVIKFICPNCPPSMTGILKMESLYPGAATVYNWPSPSAIPEKWTKGTYTIQAIVDPNRIVQDSNRTNNHKILKFLVQGVLISKKKVTIAKKPFTPDKLTQITVGKRITSGFDFTTQPELGTTGKRIVQSFNFSTIPEGGTTGIRTVSGFNFSTQPAPGTTGTRTVQGFDFIIQ